MRHIVKGGCYSCIWNSNVLDFEIDVCVYSFTSSIHVCMHLYIISNETPQTARSPSFSSVCPLVFVPTSVAFAVLFDAAKKKKTCLQTDALSTIHEDPRWNDIPFLYADTFTKHANFHFVIVRPCACACRPVGVSSGGMLVELQLHREHGLQKPAVHVESEEDSSDQYH